MHGVTDSIAACRNARDGKARCIDAQVEAEKQLDPAGAPDKPLDPYNNRLIMPLAEFVAHPMVDDVLGNGQAMQVCTSDLKCPAWDLDSCWTAFHCYVL